MGPSGVGKKTLLNAILEKYSDLFEKKRSVTTRKPREGESMGMFDFVSAADFHRMKEANDFIEYRERLHGTMYGTSKSELKRIQD